MMHRMGNQARAGALQCSSPFYMGERIWWKGSACLIVQTSAKLYAFDVALQRAERLEIAVEVGIPDAPSLFEILRNLVGVGSSTRKGVLTTTPLAL